MRPGSPAGTGCGGAVPHRCGGPGRPVRRPPAAARRRCNIRYGRPGSYGASPSALPQNRPGLPLARGRYGRGSIGPRIERRQFGPRYCPNPRSGRLLRLPEHANQEPSSDRSVAGTPPCSARAAVRNSGSLRVGSLVKLGRGPHERVPGRPDILRRTAFSMRGIRIAAGRPGR